MTELGQLLNFVVFALVFVATLTLVVRLVRLRVRADLAYARAVGLTALLVGLVLVVWWFVTRGAPGQRMVQPLILPSPMEVLQVFRALCISNRAWCAASCVLAAGDSGLRLGRPRRPPLGVYMATFAPVAAFFRPLSLAGAYVPIVVFIP